MLHHSFEIVIFFSCCLRLPNLDHLLGACNVYVVNVDSIMQLMDCQKFPS